MKLPHRIKNEVGLGLAGVMIAALVVLGLAVVGYFVFMGIAMASWANNK